MGVKMRLGRYGYTLYGSELMWVRICEWEDVGGKRWMGGLLKICGWRDMDVKFWA